MDKILKALPDDRAAYDRHQKQTIDGSWVAAVYEHQETGQAYACRGMGGCKFVFIPVNRFRGDDWSTV
jgi:hypothetical protein